MNKNKKKTIILTILIVLSNIVYFFIYAKILYGQYGFMDLFFTTVATLSYLSFLIIFRQKIVIRWMLYFAIICLYIWSLFNFAFYKVFHSFYNIQLNHIQVFQGTIGSLLFDFYKYVPFFIYIIAFVFCFLIFKLSSSLVRQVSFSKINNWFVLLSFFILQISVFGYLQYYQKNPKISWREISSQTVDYGLIGYTYSEINRLFFIKNKVYAQTDSVSVLQDLKTKYDFYNKSLANNQIILPDFKDHPNIVMIQLESIGQWAVDNNPSPMPFLKKLIAENITVENFYPNSCQTINSEFSSLCSAWSNSFEPVSYSHTDNRYNCLPSILKKEKNYETYFFHANDSGFWRRDLLLNKWGFENQYLSSFFREKENDASTYPKMVDVLSESKQPFLAYFTSYTSHAPHGDETRDMYREDFGLDIKLFEGLINSEYKNLELNDYAVRTYYGFLTAADNALKIFFDEMKEANLLENSIIVIYNDHRYYNFLGGALDDFYRYNKSPFVLVLPEKQKGVAKLYGSHLDIAPTLLHLINQSTDNQPTNFVGSSLFDDNSSSQVLNKCLGGVFYINDEILIEGNVKTNQYYVKEQKKVLPQNQIDDYLNFVSDIVQVSDFIIYNDKLVQ